MAGPYALSGTGVQAIVTCAWLQVTVTALNPNGRNGRGFPVNRFDQALITPGNANGYYQEIPVSESPMLIPITPDVDRFGFACIGGAQISVTEIQPLTTSHDSSVARGQFPADTTTLLYTVPAESTFIAKSLIYHGSTAGLTGIFFFLTSSGGSATVYLISDPAPGDAVHNLQTWFVMDAGDTLTGYCHGVSTSYWLSGTVVT